MSKHKQQTANYAFRFANFAFELAREEENNPDRARYRQAFTVALALVRHSNHLLAMAEEEAETLNLHDPLEVRDFEANWRQGLNWWNKLVVEFLDGLDWEAEHRLQMHMQEFWGKAD